MKVLLLFLALSLAYCVDPAPVPVELRSASFTAKPNSCGICTFEFSFIDLGKTEERNLTLLSKDDFFYFKCDQLDHEGAKVHIGDPGFMGIVQFDNF